MPWGLCDDAGRNNISSFDNVMYLRQFKKLRLVNLAGNPIAGAADYRSYVLSHIKDLTYLDYRRVNAADVAAAMEQHQVTGSSLRWLLLAETHGHIAYLHVSRTHVYRPTSDSPESIATLT